MFHSSTAIEEKKEEEGEEKKPKKKITEKDIDQYEKELELLKTIHLDLLVERVLKNKLQKNAQLKNEELIKDLIQSSFKPIEKPSLSAEQDLLQQNVESRLISQKEVANEVEATLSAFKSIILGDSEKIEKRKAAELKKKTAEENKKRKAEEAEINPKKPKVMKKKPEVAGTSEFVETLGVSDDENDDENFAKIYEGEKKPNRVGQRQRRK